MEYKEFTEEFLQSEKLNFVIPKANGEFLDGFALPGNSDHTVIFCHGITWTRYGMVKYFDYFRENGWNIIAYDHQAHGKSPGKYPTYGVDEKKDLKLVVDWALKQFPETEAIGLFGESMGAATVLQYAPMDKRIGFIIADCPYSNFNVLMNHQLKLNHVPPFLRGGIIRLSDRITRGIAGFHTGNINPEQDIMQTDVPILLVHGREDDYVPTAMSEHMYRIRKRKSPHSARTDRGSGPRPVCQNRSRALQERT